MDMIKFGTDGWRAVIADGFTFDNLAHVCKATAAWLEDAYGSGSKVVVGYDTRFMGREFAEFSACVFAESDLDVIISDSFATTPAISWAANAYGCQAGIVITASHNPPVYNGFKIKADFGGPATPEMIAAVEDQLKSTSPTPPATSFSEHVSSGKIELRPISEDYKKILRDRLDIEAIKSGGIKIAHDAMYGTGQGVISDLLGKDRVIELRSEFNPGFGGKAPEPIEKNLGDLSRAVVSNGCSLGIANDGDADRVGMFDEKGAFVSSHLLLALLVKYLYQEKGLTGSIVKTASTTHMLDRMGEAYGLEVTTTPIGFKYIASRIVEDRVLVGGEESGGMAVMGHIPERDGIFIGLTIAEMVVKRGKKLSELVQELYDEFGDHRTFRIDAHTTESNKRAVLDRLETEKGLREINGSAVSSFSTLDGYKHTTAEGWLLVRPSGTEPVLRIYSEASSEKVAEAIVHDAMTQLGVESH
ncbi:MAG: phosphoglucomutase/phosphomannomutase family protein [Rhodothermales bacterium]|nr:phosphoglucomutase/phosphomannomutase family protein [Rhodothermales bacterium]